MVFFLFFILLVRGHYCNFIYFYFFAENNSTEGKEETNVEMTGNKIQLNQQKSPTTGNFELMSLGPIHRNSKILTLDPELTRW